MAASVTIEHTAFADRRIAFLGELAGYSHMEALGRMATLWSRCTELQTDKPGALEIKACIGPRGEELLVESGLGESIADGVRVRGCAGRTEWYAEVTDRNRKAGEIRAATAQRGQRGRFARSNPPADDQQPPAPDPIPDLSPPDLDPVRPELPDPPAIVGADLGPRPEPPPWIPNPGAGRSERVKINHDAWRYAAMKHAELGLDGSSTWPVMPAGEPANDLVKRTVEVIAMHDPPRFAEARALITRRIDVAFAEAQREGHARWFTPSRMWDSKSFWRAVEQTPDQARAPRAPPRGSPPTSPTPEPRKIKTLG